MISRMEMDRRYGLMAVFLKVLICRVVNMDRDIIHGQIRVSIKEIGIIIKFKVLVLIVGQMEESIKAIGKILKCMVKVFIHGKMEDVMMEIILKIKNMDMVLILGLMGDLIMVFGKMEFRKEEENSICLMEILEREFG